MKKCLTCEHCGEIKVPAGEGERSVFLCRAKPPVAVLVPSADGSSQITTIWPQVIPDIDYCASHLLPLAS